MILLNTGDNGIVFDDDLDKAPDRLRALLDGILEICPDTLVVVSPPASSSNSHYQARIDQLNIRPHYDR